MYVIIISFKRHYEPYVMEQVFYRYEDALGMIKDSKFHNEYPNGIYEIYKTNKVEK